jgi:hypothetical protein
MAKKSRRSRAKQRARVEKAAQERRSQQPGLASAGVQGPAPLAPKAQVARTQGPRARVAKAQDLAIHYQYVIPEVKRIGIIAGAIIVVLIILAFVLP